MGFKTGTIKKIIRNKIDHWVDNTFKEKEMQTLVKDNVIVSGGAITSLLQGDSPNDYDIYFKTFEAATRVASFYVSLFNLLKELTVKSGVKSYKPDLKIEEIKNIRGEVERRLVIYIKSAGVASQSQIEYSYFESEEEYTTDNFISSLKEDTLTDEFEKDPISTAEDLKKELTDKKYVPVFLSQNAITLNHKIQIIIRFYGTPEEIHKNFDFAHTMCYYDYKTDTLELPREALECILSKTLVYNGSLYPIASLFRIRKFIERGWRITAGQILKMVWQVNELDLKNHQVLRDQLIGVDQAYMWQLIRSLENTKEKVDSTYIAKLLDEIFE